MAHRSVFQSVLIQMSTGDILTLLRRSVRRKGPLPLSEQLRSAIEMAVIAGDLVDGAPLPSVRQLAGDLDLAPNTVVRAYRDLENEGIVQVVPRRGYYVLGIHEQELGPAFAGLQGLIDQAVRAARQEGLTDKQVLHLVAERLRAGDRNARRIAVVGRRDAALEERVAFVAQAVADLDVQVVGLSFEELRTDDGAARASGFDLYLVPVLETNEAARLLGPNSRRIMPMNRRLKPGVRAFIVAQPETARFGIIAGADEYRGRMIAALDTLHPLKTPPVAASIQDPRAVDRVIREADAVIIGSTARHALQARMPLPVPYVEFTYLPDESTLRRLRSRLTPMDTALPRAAEGGAPGYPRSTSAGSAANTIRGGHRDRSGVDRRVPQPQRRAGEPHREIPRPRWSSSSRSRSEPALMGRIGRASSLRSASASRSRRFP